MQRLNCLIIEDEPLAAEILDAYIGKLGYLERVAVCTDAISAYEILRSKKIDLIFLDIHLPKLKGLDFLKTLAAPLPKVIITSAYEQYAIEGFELEVSDYLLKPFSFERFLKAVNRIKEVSVQSKAESDDFRFFNVNKKQVKVNLDDIFYIESLKDYVKIVTRESALVTKFQIGQLEEFLNDQRFIRIHRSFVVAKDKVTAFTSTDIEISGRSIPIGRSFLPLARQQLGFLK